MPQQLPVVRCQRGGEYIALPRPSATTEERPQHYWPAGRQTLVLVCQDHGHTSVFKEKDVLLGLEPAEQDLTASRFWKVEFLCDREGCGQKVLAHARIDAGYTADDTARYLLASRPGLQCAENHVLTFKAQVLSAEVVSY